MNSIGSCCSTSRSTIADAHDLVIRSALKPPPGKMVKLTIRPQGRVETPAAKLERMKPVVTPQPPTDLLLKSPPPTTVVPSSRVRNRSFQISRLTRYGLSP